MPGIRIEVTALKHSKIRRFFGRIRKQTISFPSGYRNLSIGPSHAWIGAREVV